MSVPSGRSFHRHSVSTPTRPSLLREEITESMGSLGLEDGEKTPTQANYELGRSLGYEDETPDTPTPFRPIKREGGIVHGGQIRKSASTMNLAIRDEDDVFAPGDPYPGRNILAVAASGPSGVLNVAATGRGQEGINAINNTNLVQYKARGYKGFLPRMDRGLEPNASNAQGLFDPDANVFVANLSSQRSEDQLEIDCHRIFDVYGPNYIKIKADKNQRPFALVQFETVEAATEAIIKAQNTILDDREIRLEQTKAERAVVVFRPGGKVVSEDEARNLLAPFGALELVCSTAVVRGRSTNVPDGVYCKFAFYLDCRDALKGLFGNQSAVRLQLANGLHPIICRTPDGSSTFQGLTPPRPSVDARSIFVGNLPEGTTKEELREAFQNYGPIADTNVVYKTYHGGSVNIFGFVEFVNVAAANDAAEAEHYLSNQKLRVEPKEYSARRASRLRTFTAAATPARTPIRVSPAVNQVLGNLLANNEVENGNWPSPPPDFIPPPAAYPPNWETPQHWLPANLFSPTPPQPLPPFMRAPGYAPPFFEPYYYYGPPPPPPF